MTDKTGNRAGEQHHPVVQPLHALELIAAEAQAARRKLSAGLAVNGITAIQRIELIARDSIDDARQNGQS